MFCLFSLFSIVPCIGGHPYLRSTACKVRQMLAVSDLSYVCCKYFLPVYETILFFHCKILSKPSVSALAGADGRCTFASCRFLRCNNLSKDYT